MARRSNRRSRDTSSDYTRPSDMRADSHPINTPNTLHQSKRRADNRLGSVRRQATAQSPALREVGDPVRRSPVLPTTVEPDAKLNKPGRAYTEKRKPLGARKTPTPAPDRTTALDDKMTCKGRPTKNKGKGGSRSFVPWCK